MGEREQQRDQETAGAPMPATNSTMLRASPPSELSGSIM
jgi:hypothetical protein